MRSRIVISTLILMLATISVAAQIRTFIYTRVSLDDTWSGFKIVVDMGTPQEKNTGFNYNCIKDTNGKDKTFNTRIAALNWLAKDGWELFDPHTNIDSTFLMRKNVSGMNEEQVQTFLSKYNIGPSGTRARIKGKN